MQCHRLAEPTIPAMIYAGYLSDLANLETFIQGIQITGSYVRVTAGGNCAYKDSYSRRSDCETVHSQAPRKSLNVRSNFSVSRKNGALGGCDSQTRI
jgi:hypothetical protein